MSPLEAVGRAVAKFLGVGMPDAWRPFEPAIRTAIEAFINALPPDLAEQVRALVEKSS